MRLYVDGVLVAQNNSASLVANTDKPLYIGAGRTNKHPHDVDPPQFHFNGTNEYVSVPFNSTMNPSGDFSLSAWVKLSNKNDYR